jgi:hypothetical protein
MENENKQKLKIKMPPLKNKYANDINNYNKINYFAKIHNNVYLNPKKINIERRNSNPNLFIGINKSDETNLENSHKGILKSQTNTYIKKSKSVKFNENQPEKFIFKEGIFNNENHFKQKNDNEINDIDSDFEENNNNKGKVFCTCTCIIF